jgi:hypothetical protein
MADPVKARDRGQSRIAQEAARMMFEEGVEDYGRARTKAAARLGMRDLRQMPDNDAIDFARQEYRRLYSSPSRPDPLLTLRRVALDVMLRLKQFGPRLVGSVADGSAGPHSPITIHVFPDAPEDVLKELIELGIPFSEGNYPHQAGSRDRVVQVPGLSFFSDRCRIDIVMFSPESRGLAQRYRKTESARLSPTDLLRILGVSNDTESPT